jgi:hypothetical protein
MSNDNGSGFNGIETQFGLRDDLPLKDRVQLIGDVGYVVSEHHHSQMVILEGASLRLFVVLAYLASLCLSQLC